MVGRTKNERTLYVTVLAVVALTIGIVVLTRHPSRKTTTSHVTNNPSRLTYAQLYEAAWRQDAGRGNTTITATLVTPALIDALNLDKQRSERDEQILYFTKNLPDTQVAFIVTIDSIAGYFSDSQILESVKAKDAQSASGNEWFSQAWKPLIGTKTPVNANVAVSSQAGVLIMNRAQKIDWSTLKNLQLSFSDLGDQPIRQFTWAEPRLLADTPE